VNDLRTFVALQARLYEFLEQQEETTLLAIASGAMKLAVVRTGDTHVPAGSAPASAVPTTAPPRDPSQAAQDLSKLTPNELKQLAKARGLVGYSRLRKPELINLLQNQDPDPADTPTSEPGTPAPPAGTAKPNTDPATIASHLREIETEEEGAAYLHAQHLDQESLLAVAAELQLTRVSRLNRTELEKRVLKQAIVARRKFAGLRSW
jgi:Rho termination factor, N-terminal domain